MAVGDGGSMIGDIFEAAGAIVTEAGDTVKGASDAVTSQVRGEELKVCTCSMCREATARMQANATRSTAS